MEGYDLTWRNPGVEQSEVEVQQQKGPQLWGLYGNPNYTNPRDELFIMKYNEQKNPWEYNLPEYETRTLEKLWSHNTDKWLEIGEFKNVLLTYQILCGRFDNVERIEDIEVIMNDPEDKGNIVNEELQKMVDELNQIEFENEQYRKIKEEGL